MTAGAPYVLIVDDSPLVTEALGALLDACGYRTGAAHSVTAALAALHAGPCDAMLLDLTLPDGDGLEVLAELAAEGVPLPATLALTGHDDPDTAARCLAAGCRAVLAKPVRAAALLAALRGAGVAAAARGPNT